MKALFLLLCLGVTSICFGQDWVINIDEAKRLAVEQNKPILILFEGSDWCGPCQRMERDIWTTDTFLDYAKEELVLLKIDFTRRPKNRPTKAIREHHTAVADKYHKSGMFPHVVLINVQGDVLGKANFTTSEPTDFLMIIKEMF